MIILGINKFFSWKSKLYFKTAAFHLFLEKKLQLKFYVN